MGHTLEEIETGILRRNFQVLKVTDAKHDAQGKLTEINVHSRYSTLNGSQPIVFDINGKCTSPDGKKQFQHYDLFND